MLFSQQMAVWVWNSSRSAGTFIKVFTALGSAPDLLLLTMLPQECRCAAESCVCVSLNCAEAENCFRDLTVIS